MTGGQVIAAPSRRHRVPRTKSGGFGEAQSLEQGTGGYRERFGDRGATAPWRGGKNSRTQTGIPAVYGDGTSRRARADDGYVPNHEAYSDITSMPWERRSDSGSRPRRRVLSLDRGGSRMHRKRHF